ncbi:MAG: hypothetical protein P8Y93_09145 [Acidobacteriota bacterium]
MPRRPRLVVCGAISHFFCRIARGELVVDEHDEAAEVIETLRKVRDVDGLTIFAWCLELIDRLQGLDVVSVDRLSSRSSGAEPTLIRAESAALAIGRYQARTCDVADLLGKHPNSITRWLDRGLRLEREDPDFKRRVDTLDEAASRRD